MPNLYPDQWEATRPVLKGKDPNAGYSPLEGEGVNERAFMRSRFFTLSEAAKIKEKFFADTKVKISDPISDYRYHMDPTDNNGNPRSFYFFRIGKNETVFEAGTLFLTSCAPYVGQDGVFTYNEDTDTLGFDPKVRTSGSPLPPPVALTEEEKRILKSIVDRFGV